MSVETGQRLLDCRLLWTTHARNPALGARVGERLEVPLNDDVLPRGPRLAGVGKLDVIELSSDKSAFSGINRRMLRAHRRHPVVDGSTPIFPGSDARRFVLQPHGNILRGLKKWAASRWRPSLCHERRKGKRNSVVLVDPLAPLVALLRLDREGSDRARLESFERDRLAGLLAVAVGPVFEAGERRRGLRDPVWLVGPRAALEPPARLPAGA